MGELAILVPVLDRPHRVEPTLASIRETAPTAHILFICDEGDEAEISALAAAGADHIELGDAPNYARKINAGFAATTEPLLFMAADDLRYHEGWFERACKHLSEDVSVVGTNDIANPRVMMGQHSTHSLFTREYIEELGTIDEPGKVLHEGYPHEYCDDEFIQTAMSRGRYSHAFDAIVEHLHPIVGNKAPDDATYRKGRSLTRVGRRLFQRRKQLWT